MLYSPSAITAEQAGALGGYRVIYADPPWSYSDKGGNGGIGAHYPGMDVAAICALPVALLAAPDAALFLWGVYPFLPEALRVIKAWGFSYKSLAFDWVKTYPSGVPTFGLGRWTRGSSEPCLLGVRGKPERVHKGVRQLVESSEQEILHAVRGEHSAKPPEVRARIAQLMGDQPALELFARVKTPGWDCWGNEVESDVIL